VDSIVHSKKFMVSPMGFQFEEVIEAMLNSLHMDFLMSNQLIVGKKRPS